MLARLFDECLQRIQAGEPVSACLERYPQYADQLRPLLETAAAVRASVEPAPRDAERAALRRAEYLAAVQKMHVAPVRRSAWQRLMIWADELVQGVRGMTVMPRGLAATLATILLVGALGTGAVNASATALPGDTLYRVKLAAEEARLFFTSDPASRQALSVQLEGQRISEAAAVVGMRRHVENLPLVGRIESMNDSEWRVSGLHVRIDAATSVSGVPEVGAQVHGEAQAPGDGTLRALQVTVNDGRSGLTADQVSSTATSAARTSLQPNATRTPQATSSHPSAPANVTATAAAAKEYLRVHLVDNVRAIRAGTWEIGDESIVVDSATSLLGSPDVRSRVDALITAMPNGQLRAVSIQTVADNAATAGLVTLSGSFSQRSGTLWTVAGSVVRVDSQTLVLGGPVLGNGLEIKAQRQSDGSLHALVVNVQKVSEVVIDGTVTSVTPDIIVIDGQKVVRNRQTAVVGSLEVGVSAAAVAKRGKDGQLVATSILLLPSGDLGMIEQIMMMPKADRAPGEPSPETVPGDSLAHRIASQ